MNKIDKVGHRYGRLLVVSQDNSRIFNGKKKIVFWNCVCDCGNTKSIASDKLKEGYTRSCGCLLNEMIASVNLKHGEANKTKENRTWFKMKGRCYTVSDAKFKNYGARGIKVCDRWLNSYEDFLQDMGRAPSPEYSIDRIDVNGNYEPSNCRWATNKEQSLNKTNNVFLSFNGETKTMSQWAEVLGYKYKHFHSLIKYKGKTLDELSKTVNYVRF